MFTCAPLFYLPNLLREKLCKFSFKFVPLEVMCDDFTVLADKHAGGNALHHVVEASRAIPRLQIGNVIPCEVLLLNSFCPLLLILIERNAVDVKTFIVELLVNFDEDGVELSAGTAPRGPEIE